MANFKPQEILLGAINGGVRYANGDIVDAEAINAPIEASAYAQEEARNARAESSEALAKVNDSAHGSVSLSAYPVGSIYISTASVSPASLFGGTWERIAEGRALFGAGTLNGKTYVANTNISHGLPNITGSFDIRHGVGDGIASVGNGQGAFRDISVQQAETVWNNGFSTYTDSRPNDKVNFAADASNNIYGSSDTVQPNAYVVYMWKRVS